MSKDFKCFQLVQEAKPKWPECKSFSGGGIGFDWPFDFAQGRAELEFWAGIGPSTSLRVEQSSSFGFVWVCFG